MLGRRVGRRLDAFDDDGRARVDHHGLDARLVMDDLRVVRTDRFRRRGIEDRLVRVFPLLEELAALRALAAPPAGDDVALGAGLRARAIEETVERFAGVAHLSLTDRLRHAGSSLL